MIIELHAIQSFGPTNLNRDDTGNPKDSLFGGVRRARISSQSAKRAIRVSSIFKKAIGVDSGVRTKLLIKEVTERLKQEGVEEDSARTAATSVISAVFAKPDKKDADKTNVLVYISSAEFELLAEYILEATRQGAALDEKQLRRDFAKRLQDRAIAPDIALFGRMLADNPSVSVDAACQVAHALSTHEVNTAEFDYFTAVDDLTPEDESGAGMLGLLAYNSATYYRCARIDWEQLVKNLHGDLDLAQRTVRGFMQAFALVVPSGKQNSFVNQHAPDFLMAVVRPDNDGQSLDNAFEQPVRVQRGSGGFVAPSIAKLATYWEQVDRAFRLSDPFISVMNPRQFDLPSTELAAAVQPNLNEWIAVVAKQIEKVEV